MALCESQLDSGLGKLKREGKSAEVPKDSPEKRLKMDHNGIYNLDQVPAGLPGGLPLSVDYRSPVSHFVPPAVELYAARHKQEAMHAQSSVTTTTPMKRKRGRPRIDKSSPEYLANLAARKQAREMAAMMNSSRQPSEPGEKRKRGRPRVDKTSPEYLARKRVRELEALDRKAKKEHKRRTGGAAKSLPRSVKTSTNRLPKNVQKNNMAVSVRKLQQKLVRKIADKKIVMRRNSKYMKRKDSATSSSTGELIPKAKRKYTKRTPDSKKESNTTDKVKGKRGRPRKSEQVSANNKQMPQAKIRVRSNLMPDSSEPINLDSDEEPDLGSPSQTSDSLSLDENLRALRHIHEKYANIDKDDLYEAHLLAANFKKPSQDSGQRNRDDDDVLSIRSSDGNGSVKDLDSRVEKLEDGSDSDTGSTSSGSGSSSSGSSSSSSSGSSSSSDSSDSDSGSEDERPKEEQPPMAHNEDDSRSFGAWSHSGPASDSDTDPERAADVPPPQENDVSESENESPDKSFQCHICRKWYSTKVTLKIHRRSHQNRGGGNSRSRTRSSDRYECDCCNETFNRREKLWEHKAEAHRGSMTVRCEVCRKCFEDDSELAAHDRTHTDDERAGRCGECGATFQRYEQLRRHRSCAHGAAPDGMPHACAQCGKRFSHAHSLTRHLHNHAKQLYRCVVCKASFARADQLAQHLNSHLANYKRLKP
ncbi:myoneurin isoform X1 [Bombyx mori]|uniref:C2H2-type domain-containing protein n=1 Tax=Bombyx mori TaxID=7091 RepID=A0A8R2C7G1_BOMMO|nr:myoneurin isoform X1 [Bombyx mori]XP_012548439.2 myoneurin isoform X1 [Bombyx mori]